MGHFPRLTAAALDLAPDTYDFTQTITDTLGSLGTPADGFDAYLAATIPLLSSGGDFGSSLDGDLGLAAGVLSLINPNSLASDAASFPASLAEGDAIVADANALLGATSGTPTPAPVSGGPPPPPANPLAGCDFGGKELSFDSPNQGNPRLPNDLSFWIHEDDGSLADVTAARLIAGDASLMIKIVIERLPRQLPPDPRYPQHGITLTLTPYKNALFHVRLGIKTVRVPTERTQCIQIDTTQNVQGGGGGFGGLPRNA
jgi:hypothetical protein